ncbi:MAG: carotenoid biosynthesis protein, partial [Bacteroidales bacterium]|nr:carotenoid biosynthesis protein [Bacteroidales bacterium]
IKLFDTPLLIGINWLFMVYSSAAIVEKWRLPRLLKIAAAASLMVVYDLVLEQSAPRLDMWHWQQEVIPLQNYGAWFVLSLLFQGLLPLWGVRIHNRLALLIMGCQILFFLLLFVLFQWMP